MKGYHYLDTPITSALAMENVNINAIPPGTKFFERSGTKIHIHKVLIKGDILLSSQTSAGFTNDVVTICLVLDMQNNGAKFTALDLMTLDTYNSFLNPANEDRFVMIWYKQYAMMCSGATNTSQTCDLEICTYANVWGSHIKLVDEEIKLDTHIEFDTSSGPEGFEDISENCLWVCTWTKNERAAFTGKARIHFTNTLGRIHKKIKL